MLCEQSSEPLENRITYIKQNKPKNEVSTRLRLLKPATGIAEAWAEYQKIQQPAWAEYEKLQQHAFAEYEKLQQPAWAEFEKKKEALHKEQCPNCPWNGKTIFPSM